jgi:hypothetical protein
LLDLLTIHLVPVVLGRGADAPGVTHLTYRVVK